MSDRLQRSPTSPKSIGGMFIVGVAERDPDKDFAIFRYGEIVPNERRATCECSLGNRCDSQALSSKQKMS